MTRPGYLLRLDSRQRTAALKQRIVFGLVLGWILTLTSAFYYYLVPGAADIVWHALTWCGLVLLLLTMACPDSLAVPERLWMKGARGLGTVVFSILLVIIYSVLILPVGIVLRRLKGMDPFYAWKDGENAPPAEGWVAKILPAGSQAVTRSAKRSLPTQAFTLLSHFIRSGQYVFLPLLILLLLLGLVLFFVESSALAPFIYTLF